MTDFSDEDKIKAEYYIKIELFLKLVIDAHKVVIFDHPVHLHIYGQEEGSMQNGK